jgi:cell fate (sporulation/competence/biofilm development) regulator YlbF (YheA/YmcA/DUF963 family)
MNNDTDKIWAAANTLAETLKDSQLYKDYRKSRIQLEQYPNVAAKVRQFKQLQAEYEAKSDLSFDEEKTISYSYAELMRHSAAAAFLEREQTLLHTYGRLIELIDQAWDIDLFE